MPALTFCCGAECGIVVAGAAPGAGGERHWDTIVGAVTVDTATVHSGIRSYKFFTAGGTALSVNKNVASPTVVVSRFYVYFETLPSADCNIWAAIVATGTSPTVKFAAADGKLYASVSVNGATGVAVVPGKWYLVDVTADVSGTTRKCDAKVDGVTLGQATQSTTASTITGVKFGVNVNAASSSANATLYIDDMAVSITFADYPIGAGIVAGLYPVADGSHSLAGAGSFLYNNLTNTGVAPTDTYSYVDDTLDGIADFIAAVAASITEYLEWRMGGLEYGVSSINGVQITFSSHSADVLSNKQTLRLNDGGTLSDVCTDLDQSQTTVTYHTKHYTTAPSSGIAWTKAKVDGMRLRWNSSYTVVDETPVPFMDALCAEIDYLPIARGALSQSAADILSVVR